MQIEILNTNREASRKISEEQEAYAIGYEEGWASVGYAHETGVSALAIDVAKTARKEADYYRRAYGDGLEEYYYLGFIYGFMSHS